MALDPHNIKLDRQEEGGAAISPLSGTRAQRFQRLQVGLFGLAAMVMVVGLADIIMSTAESNQPATSDELLPVTAEDVPPPPQRDPLAEAGVVPDLPAEPEVVETSTPALLPPVGNGDVPPPQAAD